MKLFFVDALIDSGTDLYSVYMHVDAGNVANAIKAFCAKADIARESIRAVEVKNVSPVL